MSITVAKIDRVAPEEAYMGNDKTYFTDTDGVSAYTFSKIFEGQSYEGAYRSDRRGQTQFKKESNFQGPSTPSAPAQAPLPTPTPQNTPASVERFEKAVEDFAASVEILSILLADQRIAPSGDVVPTKLNDKEVEEFFKPNGR